jgi:hypothetical protein
MLTSFVEFFAEKPAEGAPDSAFIPSVSIDKKRARPYKPSLNRRILYRLQGIKHESRPVQQSVFFSLYECDSAERACRFLRTMRHRRQDVIRLNPVRPAWPFGCNPRIYRS